MPASPIVDTRVTVETPEGVDFQFVIAGPGKRSLSFLADSCIKLAVVIGAFMVVGAVSGIGGEVSGVAFGMALVTWFVMSWLYGSCCEAFWHGQTPGKRMLNLRVVRSNGTPIGWFEAFGRNLLLFADGMLPVWILPLCTVGLLSMALTKRMQRLGDLVFDTMVIDETREFITRNPEITHGIQPISRNECVGRYHIPERTLAVIERLFEGDRLIADGRREEIARALSTALQKRLGYIEPEPDPANPNQYFARNAFKHTLFLKRVLKTFSADYETRPQKNRGQDFENAELADDLSVSNGHTHDLPEAGSSRRSRSAGHAAAEPEAATDATSTVLEMVSDDLLDRDSAGNGVRPSDQGAPS